MQLETRVFINCESVWYVRNWICQGICQRLIFTIHFWTCIMAQTKKISEDIPIKELMMLIGLKNPAKLSICFGFYKSTYREMQQIKTIKQIQNHQDWSNSKDHCWSKLCISQQGWQEIQDNFNLLFDLNEKNKQHNRMLFYL